MTDEELIRIGIIAGRELNVPPDAKIEMASGVFFHHVTTKIKEGCPYDFYETDTVDPRLWAWKRDNGTWEVGLGYSERCKTLVIWPDMVKSKPVDVISK